MINKIKIGLVQLKSSADVASNIDKTVDWVRKAASQGAKIVCLQELYSSLYFCSAEKQEFFDLAEALDGRSVSSMQKIAKELAITIIVPFYERRAAGLYHNTVAVVDEDGSVIGLYRKMHIPHDPLFYEKYYFTPGESSQESPGFRIFTTRYAKIGVLICWDQWYPEAARITSLMGAEILFYPTAIGWHPAEKEQYGAAQVSAWQTAQRAHAIANGVFVAAVNRVGHEATPGTDGIEFFGRSFISDPFGVVLTESTEQNEQVLIAECDLAKIEDTRRNWPFLRDRRVDAYAPILNRYIER